VVNKTNHDTCLIGCKCDGSKFVTALLSCRCCMTVRGIVLLHNKLSRPFPNNLLRCLLPVVGKTIPPETSMPGLGTLSDDAFGRRRALGRSRAFLRAVRFQNNNKLTLKITKPSQGLQIRKKAYPATGRGPFCRLRSRSSLTLALLGVQITLKRRPWPSGWSASFS
jgi:hypothetical protein